MAVSEHWRYQGRQYHQWFGHGTAPKEEKEAAPAKPGSLFDPLSVGQRVDYASGSVVAHSPRDQRSRWETRVSGGNRESLKTAVAVWYGASKLSRDAFRQRLLDPNTDDDTVDRLRTAAKGIVDARTHAQLSVAGEDLTTAAQEIGPDRWPRFIGDAERRGVAAVSDGAIPGVIKASATGTDTALSAITLGLVLLTLALKNQGSGPPRPTVMPSTPTSVPPATPIDETAGNALKAEPPAGMGPDLTPGPGGVVVSDDQRKHILDGDDKGGGGHGPGRNQPNKTEFPSGWSDDQVINAVKDVANDPESSRRVQENGRIAVTGTRDGVEIEVIIEPDKKTVVTGYPTNLPRNPKRER